MPKWRFDHEKNTSATGAADSAVFKKTGHNPYPVEGDNASKRNVIATSAGWVRRTFKVDTHGNTRQQEEVLVAANPGVQGKDYSSNAYLAFPDIHQVYVKLDADGQITANAIANVYVVFNEPLRFKGDTAANTLTITLANTAGGNHAVFTANSNVLAGTGMLLGAGTANNTVIFRGKLQGGANGSDLAATYQVNAQSISVTGGGNPLYNPDDGTTAAANLVITGAVANNLCDGKGTRVTTFQVKI
jgi:hypothetical protein